METGRSGSGCLRHRFNLAVSEGRFAAGVRFRAVLVTAGLNFLAAACATSRPPGVPSRTVEPERVVIRNNLVTPPAMLPIRESDEATSAELGSALAEGVAVREELDWVRREEAVSSGQMTAGQYLVTYLITPSDDYYDLEAATSDLPAHHTTVLPGSAHVAILVQDAADGRIVQGLDVRATIGTDGSAERRTIGLPYGWHPVLNRYGDNVVLPASPFTLGVHIGMPGYARHDSVNGNRFRGTVVARFSGITVSADSLAAAAQRLARGEPHSAVIFSEREGGEVDRPLHELLRRPGTDGAQVRSGDYRIAVVVTRGHGYWEVHDEKLSYRQPVSRAGRVMHIDVSIRDATTGRFIPDMHVQAAIVDSRNRTIGNYELPMTWHPWFYHYGQDVEVSGSERYAIRVRAEAPAVRRYGSVALRKFNRPINVLVRGIHFATGTQ